MAELLDLKVGVAQYDDLLIGWDAEDGTVRISQVVQIGRHRLNLALQLRRNPTLWQRTGDVIVVADREEVIEYQPNGYWAVRKQFRDLTRKSVQAALTAMVDKFKQWDAQHRLSLRFLQRRVGEQKQWVVRSVQTWRQLACRLDFKATVLDVLLAREDLPQLCEQYDEAIFSDALPGLRELLKLAEFLQIPVPSFDE